MTLGPEDFEIFGHPDTRMDPGNREYMARGLAPELGLSPDADESEVWKRAEALFFDFDSESGESLLRQRMAKLGINNGEILTEEQFFDRVANIWYEAEGYEDMSVLIGRFGLPKTATPQQVFKRMRLLAFDGRRLRQAEWRHLSRRLDIREELSDEAFKIRLAGIRGKISGQLGSAEA